MRGWDINTDKGRERLKAINERMKASGVSDDEISKAFQAFRGLK
jgi:hypothetical protein